MNSSIKKPSHTYSLLLVVLIMAPALVLASENLNLMGDPAKGNMAWNGKTLDTFLTSPLKAVPGTIMNYGDIRVNKVYRFNQLLKKSYTF